MPRAYRSDRRQAQAMQTRRRVLAAATWQFESRGWAGTTMRGVAGEAGLSVPTVETLFGSKAGLLKAAIDVAIVGDDEEVPVLDRSWTAKAYDAESAAGVLDAVAAVIAPAQDRSAGLVLAVLEGAGADPDLARLAEEMVAQRRRTASWIIDVLTAKGPLREDREAATDTLWTLMDPAVFDRLVRRLGWSVGRYRAWFASSAEHLLVPDLAPAPPRRKATR
ncbi:MAG: helix-turn-helix domain-containing protein [Marmoricola sp.]